MMTYRPYLSIILNQTLKYFDGTSPYSNQDYTTHSFKRRATGRFLDASGGQLSRGMRARARIGRKPMAFAKLLEKCSVWI